MALFAVLVDFMGSKLSPISLFGGNVRKWLPLVPLLLILPVIPYPVDSFQINVDPSFNTGASQPHQTTKKLFPYQEHGVERLLDRRHLLLCDDPGLGKTIQCIEALNRIGKEDSIILVICPKSVLGVWQSELEEWLAPHLAASWGIHIASVKDKPVPRPGTITLLNYDITWKLEEELHSLTFDVLICDECHYLKSLDSKRTKTILGDLTKKDPKPGIRADYMWLLTGTPVLNRPVELFTLVHAIDPMEFPTFEEYANRYCDPKTRTVFQRRGHAVTIKDYSGASNLEELSKRLEAIMVRRYKMDVLSQLPPKFRSCICLAGGEDIAIQERELLRAALEESNITESVTGGMDLDDFGSSAEKLMSYLQNSRSDNEILAKISAVRQATALRKLKPALELLDEYITQEKVVVFVHHRAVYDAVMEHYGDQAVGIKGGMEGSDRDAAVRRFQDDPNVRVFVGSIRAAGLGLTLTASSHVVFLELDWSPGVMNQAEDRCHRVGQANSVRIKYFVFKDTIDAWLSKSLMFKQSSINQILPEKLSGAEGTGYVFTFGKHGEYSSSWACFSLLFGSQQAAFCLQKELV
jgi:SWI/SNF-related matrix-associated actin-dependent regulator of chromatin subfamily A-like protein 1